MSNTWAMTSTPAGVYSVNDSTNLDWANSSLPAGCVILPVSSFVPWDNDQQLLSLQTEQTFDMVVAVFVLYICFCISLPTNLLNIAVFAKQGLRVRINLCLFVLAVADLGYMAVNFLLYCERGYLEMTQQSRRGPVFRFMINNNLVIFYAFQWASGFMTMMIACERCFCVVSPLRSQLIFQTRTTLLTIVLGFVVIFACAGVVCLRWSVACVFDPRTGIAVQEMYPSTFYLLHRQLVDVMDGVVLGIALPFTFLTCVTAATALTLLALRHLASWRRQQAALTSARGAALTLRDVSLTRMLVGCSVLFVLTNLPSLAFRISILFAPELNLGRRQHNVFNFLISVTELCAYLNCTCNFFIYYVMGARYRQTLRALFRSQSSMKGEHPTLSKKVSHITAGLCMVLGPGPVNKQVKNTQITITQVINSRSHKLAIHDRTI